MFSWLKSVIYDLLFADFGDTSITLTDDSIVHSLTSNALLLLSTLICPSKTFLKMHDIYYRRFASGGYLLLYTILYNYYYIMSIVQPVLMLLLTA
jgi:hypothetical protein